MHTRTMNLSVRVDTADPVADVYLAILARDRERGSLWVWPRRGGSLQRDACGDIPMQYAQYGGTR